MPVLLLTATLTVEMEQKLQTILGCERMTVIRLCAERLELKYSVRTLPLEGTELEDMDMEVARLLKSRLKEFGDEDRAIVYCLQRRRAEKLTAFLNEQLGEEVCGTYHAEMQEDERKVAYKSWKQGVFRCVVATSALGAGIDHAAVRLVIHHGHARSIIDLGQETGRGGRDGKPAECITVFWPGMLYTSDWLDEMERNEVLKWINDMGCRRSAIGKYLNGHGVDCLSLRNAQHCDKCEEACQRGDQLVVTGSLSMRKSSAMLLERREIHDGGDLKEMIAELRGHCTVCYFSTRGQEKPTHALQKCRYCLNIQEITNRQEGFWEMSVLSEPVSFISGL